ncbi:zinc ribbon domain-containing protein, partial [Paenibacillus larvae]
MYKAESAGRVDPRHTSQLCSSCGSIVKKTLSVRVHRCD